MEKLCLAVTITIALYLLLNIPNNPGRKANLFLGWLQGNTVELSVPALS